MLDASDDRLLSRQPRLDPLGLPAAVTVKRAINPSPVSFTLATAASTRVAGKTKKTAASQKLASSGTTLRPSAMERRVRALRVWGHLQA